MKPPRFPLYGKILLWFLANLLVLTTLGVLFLQAQFRLGLDWMLAGPSGERLELFAENLTTELRRNSEEEWGAVLTRQEAETGLHLALVGSDGLQKLGLPLEDVPAEVRAKLVDKRRAEDMPPRRPRSQDFASPSLEERGQPPKPRFMLRSAQPVRYWAGIHLPLAYGNGPERRPLTLVIVSDSLTGRGLFLNPWPWAGLVAGGLVISALIWLPLVTRITRTIRQTNEASRQIAAGQFNVRVPNRGQDELGELAGSVNIMAAKLGQYVAEQRRINADIAHELCSPISRMQMALGVLEQRATPDQGSLLTTLDAELQRMARLVEEILEFSKAEMRPQREIPERIELLGFFQKVIEREGPDCAISLDVPDGLGVTTLPNALDRALGNVLRNAVRYAVQSGPIRLEAREGDGRVQIRVLDQGPGVPEESLTKLFDPFYRPEAARQRKTGGSGLGLAIAKRNVEACGGTIAAELNQPHGLLVTIELPA